MTSVDIPQPTVSYSVSEETRAAFAAEFITDAPDGYYVESGPNMDQITLINVSKGFRFSVIFDKDDGTCFYPMLINAVMDMGRNAGQVSLLEQENKLLKEQLAIARQNQFGTSSEQQRLPENIEPVDVQQAEPAAQPDSPKLRLVSNAGRKPLPPHLPREEVKHTLPESECTCACCNGRMSKIGEDITERVKYIPARVVVTKHLNAKYVCRKCDRFITASVPKSMVPGSNYGSPEFLAQIACSKYQFGLPFYRQETLFAQADLSINRTTLSNLMITCADRLTALHLALKDELLSQRIIHADETTFQVLKETDRKAESKSYAWLFRSAASASHQVVQFEYQPTRAGEHPRTYLQGFKGYLHVDGYAGYNNIPDTLRVGCMAHVRRKFVEAAKVIPEKYTEHAHAQQAIKLIGQLYGIEEKLKGEHHKIKFEVRHKDSMPILLNLKKWLDDMKPKVLPKSALGKAIGYATEQWPTVLRYVDDGELAIDNNIAERSIKSFVIGRKNWLFADSVDGAYANTVMYSLIQTAVANKLDPYKYLIHVFETMPNLHAPEAIKLLLPWNVRLDETLELLAA
ncbi:MAG: IS66 family transposase [Proteobacteria bacterium]|nr:IS66 family transposase [Pseudomonadota bacterium]